MVYLILLTYTASLVAILWSDRLGEVLRIRPEAVDATCVAVVVTFFALSIVTGFN